MTRKAFHLAEKTWSNTRHSPPLHFCAGTQYFTRGNFLLCTQMTCQSRTSSSLTTSSPKKVKNAAASAADMEEEECTPPSPSSHASSNSSISTSSNVSMSKAVGLKSSSSEVPIKSSSPKRVTSLVELGKKANQLSALPQQQQQGRDRSMSMELRKALQSTVFGPYLPTTPSSQDHSLLRTTATGAGDYDPHRGRCGSYRDSHFSPDELYSRQQDILRGTTDTTATRTGNHPPWMNNRNHPQDNGQHQIPQWTTSASPHQPLSTVTDPQQLIILQNLLGINTSTSRNHQHIMAEALGALKSCNDTELLLKKASSSYSNMVQQQPHPLEHPQYTINHHHWTSARRLHQLGGGGGNTKIAASRNQLDAMAGAMNTSAHPTLALLGSIRFTQEPGLRHSLYHHQAVDRIIRKENTPAANEEDTRNMTPLAHYLQQRRLRAKAEARLRLMRAQRSEQPETKRQRCDLAGTLPPSVSVGSGEGRGERVPEALVVVGVVDSSPTQRSSRPLLNDGASSSSLLEKASLLVNEVELEARKYHEGIVLPPKPQPQFVAVASKNVLKSPQRRPGPVRRASAA